MARQNPCRATSLLGFLVTLTFCVASTHAQSSDSANETISYQDALIQAAVVAPELAYANRSDPIPLPSDAPDYARLSRLAALFPPLEETVVQSTDGGLSEAPPTRTNDNSQPQRRQGFTRVMIVGDSITHCNEGDYTWYVLYLHVAHLLEETTNSDL